MADTAVKSAKTIVIKSMSDLDALALSKFAMPKNTRNNIAVGEHKINAKFRIVGTVTVGEDYEQNHSAALPMMKLVLKLASQVSQERLVEMLSPAVLEAITEKEVEDFSERIKAEWDKLAATTEKTCKGKVTAKLSFTKA